MKLRMNKDNHRNSFRTIIISSAIVALASIIGIIGEHNFGFYSDKEFGVLSNKLKANTDLIKKIGNIIKIEKDMANSEKENTEVGSNGIYHIRVATDKGIYNLEVTWEMSEKNISNFKIISIKTEK
jgi:hypothetical protein